MAFTHLAQVEMMNASYKDHGLHSMRPSTVESTVVSGVNLGLKGRQLRRVGLETVDLLVRAGRDNFDPTGDDWLVDIEADPDEIGMRPRMSRVSAIISKAGRMMANGVRLQSAGQPYLLKPKFTETGRLAEPLMEFPVLRVPMTAQSLEWMGDVLLMPEVNQGQEYLDMPSIQHAAVGFSN